MVLGSLWTSYLPEAFKVAVIKLLLKKLLLDPAVLTNRRLISNLLYIWNNLEWVVVKQVTDHLQNHLFEEFHLGLHHIT